MAIRISGMTSGLDTEAIVSAMVSGYKSKKDKYVKAQTKLSWKTDAYKAANKKVYSLYTSISSLRYTSAYALKKTNVSDTSKATVSASSNAINGTQSLKVNKLAKAGYLTGAQLDSSVTGSTKLSELKDATGAAFSGTGTISVTTGGKTSEISVDENTTVDQFVQKLTDAGLKASWDNTNKRIFISSSDSGKANDFVLNGSDGTGVKALSALGVFAASASNSAENLKYAALSGKSVEELKDSIQSIVNNYAEVAEKTAANKDLKAKIGYAEAYKAVGEVAHDAENVGKAGSLIRLNALLDETAQDSRYVAPDGTIYGNREEVKDENDEVIGYKYYNETTNDQGETEKTYYNAGATIDKAEALPTIGEKIKEYATELGLDEATLIAYKANRATVSAFETDHEDDANAIKAEADITTYITDKKGELSDNETAIANANASITANSIYDVNSGSYEGANVDALAQALYDKIQTAYQANNGAYSAYNNSGAVRVDGEDSEIVLNGATFTSSSNSYSINGLSITATGITTGEGISITTSTDVDGIYDKVKDFLNQYNEVVNYLQKQFNADSAKGYEPLTDDEKSEMTDKQVEKWEQKIKDSLLRRDSTIGNIMNVMSSAMAKSYQINGKSYSLSSFGISTLGYFSAPADEKYSYHIDGDEDDTYTSANKDKLKAAIAEDPDAVVDLLKNITDGLYKSLDKQMKSSSLRSAYTIYNDKEMKSEYSDYTKMIKTWETRITDMENRYFKQFAAMEKALSNMQANSSSLTGLLGG